jgi:hypothetical protein
MRIAVHHAFFGHQNAETELARRIAVAAGRLGWEAREFGSSGEIIRWAPDFVLALHFLTPKLTPFPTYGCMWNPPEFLQMSEPESFRNVLGYDGYLTSCDRSTEWVRGLLSGLGKQSLFATFYTSCPSRPWRAPQLDAARLAYLGTNWDGARYESLFRSLAKRPFVDLYGPHGRWAHAGAAHRGPLPFDGESVLTALSRSGVGLCLHRPEHIGAGIPSARIFEIVSSGAVAICQEHPFIRRMFGDAVLYLPDGLEAEALAGEIEERFHWIESHREQAAEMSRQAHAVFERHLSLEKCLEEIGRRHLGLVEAKGLSRSRRPRSQGHVQVVVRTGGRPAAMLTRALSSIAEQTYPDVSALVVRHGEVDLKPALAACRGRLEVEVIDVAPGRSRSRSLWTGLAAAKGKFIANLDDDDSWFPNHLATLVPLVAPGQGTWLAYSGTVCRLEQDAASAPAPPPEPASLTSYQRFDRARLLAFNYIASNAWVARRELVARAAGEDPRLDLFENLLLLLRFARVTDFAFSGEVTAQLFERTSRTDNTRFLGKATRAAAIARLQRMMGKPHWPRAN